MTEISRTRSFPKTVRRQEAAPLAGETPTYALGLIRSSARNSSRPANGAMVQGRSRHHVRVVKGEGQFDLLQFPGFDVLHGQVDEAKIVCLSCMFGPPFGCSEELPGPRVSQ